MLDWVLQRYVFVATDNKAGTIMIEFLMVRDFAF